MGQGLLSARSLETTPDRLHSPARQAGRSLLGLTEIQFTKAGAGKGLRERLRSRAPPTRRCSEPFARADAEHVSISHGGVAAVVICIMARASPLRLVFPLEAHAQSPFVRSPGLHRVRLLGWNLCVGQEDLCCIPGRGGGGEEGLHVRPEECATLSYRPLRWRPASSVKAYCGACLRCRRPRRCRDRGRGCLRLSTCGEWGAPAIIQPRADCLAAGVRLLLVSSVRRRDGAGAEHRNRMADTNSEPCERDSLRSMNSGGSYDFAHFTAVSALPGRRHGIRSTAALAASLLVASATRSRCF